MSGHVTILRIGSKDHEQLGQWYAKTFGWTPVKRTPDAVTFRVQCLLVELVDEAKLASELSVWYTPSDFRNMTITLGCDSREEVDKLYSRLLACRATILREPFDMIIGGYGGCVCDPEGNIWEFCYFPVNLAYGGGHDPAGKEKLLSL